MDYLFLNCSLVQSYRLQQILPAIPLLLDTLQNLVVRLCCWRHHILESLNMGRNLFKNLTQMWTLKTTIKCWPTRCDLCWHSGVNAMTVSSHFLFGFKAQSTRPKELIPDCVNYRNPVIGQAVGPRVGLNIIIPPKGHRLNCPLHSYFHTQRLVCLPTLFRELSFSKDSDGYRDPSQVNM